MQTGPLRMARPTESGLVVWITRLPGFQLRSDQAYGNGVDSSLASDSTLFPRSNLAVFDHPGPHSFVRLDEFPAVLCRDMTAVARASRGQVVARVLSANPAEPWPQPPWRRRTTGARVSLLVSGSVWFHLAGTGEESFSAKDSWYLPPGFDYALLEASSDFELLE